MKSLIRETLTAVDRLDSHPDLGQRARLVMLVESACVDQGTPRTPEAIAWAVDASGPVTAATLDVPTLTAVPESYKDWVALTNGAYQRPANPQVWAALKKGYQERVASDKRRLRRLFGGALFTLAGSMGFSWLASVLSLGEKATSAVSFGFMVVTLLFLARATSATPFAGRSERPARWWHQYQEVKLSQRDLHDWGDQADLAQWAIEADASGVPLMVGDQDILRMEAYNRQNKKERQGFTHQHVLEALKLAAWGGADKNRD